MSLLNRRDFVTPDDIKAVAPGVLSHRIITHERSLELQQEIIADTLKSVPIPVG